MWAGIIGFRIGEVVKSCVCGDEHLNSIKCKEFSGLPELVQKDSAI
jgi:hypothetical protein